MKKLSILGLGALVALGCSKAPQKAPVKVQNELTQNQEISKLVEYVKKRPTESYHPNEATAPGEPERKSKDKYFVKEFNLKGEPVRIVYKDRDTAIDSLEITVGGIGIGDMFVDFELDGFANDKSMVQERAMIRGLDVPMKKSEWTKLQKTIVDDRYTNTVKKLSKHLAKRYGWK